MSRSIDDLVAPTDPALIVVTTASQGQRAGCLVGFHTQTSIEPFRYAVWLSKANYTYRVALFATHFAVHFLSDHDEDLAELFGTRSGDFVDKFSGIAWSAGEGDVPVLDGHPAAVFAKQTMVDDGGDHVGLVGTPLSLAAARRFTPLRLSATQRLGAGHAAEERPVPDANEVTSHGDVGEPPENVGELQEAAAAFGHELTPEQVDALHVEREEQLPDGPAVR